MWRNSVWNPNYTGVAEDIRRWKMSVVQEAKSDLAKSSACSRLPVYYWVTYGLFVYELYI